MQTSGEPASAWAPTTKAANSALRAPGARTTPSRATSTHGSHAAPAKWCLRFSVDWIGPEAAHAHAARTEAPRPAPTRRARRAMPRPPSARCARTNTVYASPLGSASAAQAGG